MVCLNPQKKNCVYIDNTTASAEIARELYKKAKSAGFNFLDAPVSGGQAGAENGALTVMIGGDEEAYKKSSPIIVAFCRSNFKSFSRLSILERISEFKVLGILYACLISLLSSILSLDFFSWIREHHSSIKKGFPLDFLYSSFLVFLSMFVFFVNSSIKINE